MTVTKTPHFAPVVPDYVRLALARIIGKLRAVGHGDLVDDVLQAGAIGAWEATGRFDPARRVPLEAYARRRAAGAALDALRGLDPVTRWSRRRAEEGDVAAARHARAASLVSLSAARTPDGGRRLAEILAGRGPDPAAVAEARDEARYLLGRLPERLRRVLWQRHALSYLPRQIAQRKGISESRARQLVRQAERSARREDAHGRASR